MPDANPLHYVFADLENLIYSARNRSRSVDFALLRQALAEEGASHFLAVTSDTPMMREREEIFRRGGWHVEFCRAKHRTVGPQPKSNADSALALVIGFGCAQDKPAVITLLTGDGGLITDVGWFVARFLPGTRLEVWAFPHSLPNRWLPTDDPNVHAFRPLDESLMEEDEGAEGRRVAAGGRRWI